jgi:hypothetical protein
MYFSIFFNIKEKKNLKHEVPEKNAKMNEWRREREA